MIMRCFCGRSILIFFLLSPALYAEAPAPDAQRESAAPITELKEILAENDFGGEKEVWDIRLKEQQKTKQNSRLAAAPWVKLFSVIAAHFVRIVIIAVVIVLLVIIILKIKKLNPELPDIRKRNISISTKAAHIPAMQLLMQAEKDFSEGRLRDAWTNCFKCALAALTGAGMRFPQNATEYECLSLVHAESSAEYAAFEKLVKNRVCIAYRGLEPSAGDFAASVLFCKSLISAAHNGKKYAA